MGWCLIAAASEPNWFLTWLMYFYLFAQVALGLGFVIFVHELGHFLAAKSCGVKCEKFYVGFDVPIRIGPLRIPAALFKYQWGETEYGIGAIPLGGYVKMLGQDDNPQAAEEEAERTRIEGPDGQVSIDPRSYTSKSVPQRMFIISAGVIMNLIFAVIMCAIAYMLGVAYIPAQSGGTLPGSPAWAADLPIDAKIVQIGEEGYRSEHLRWDKDLMVKVLLNGSDDDMKFVWQFPGDEKDHEITLQPSGKGKEERRGRPAIGMLQAMSTEISMHMAEKLGHYSIYSAEPPLKTGDKIVAINGEPVTAFNDIQRIWSTQGSESLTLTVERLPEDAKEGTPPQRIDSVVPPNPVRDLGLAMNLGPISEQGIQMNSPAAEAGLRPGDVIVAINGKPAADAMNLADQLVPLVGETVEVTVERDKEQKTLNVKTRRPRMVYEAMARDAPLAVDTLGVAYHPTNVVANVESNSPAAASGIQPGDILRKVRFIPASEEQKKVEMSSIGGAGKGGGMLQFIFPRLFGPTYVAEMEMGDAGYNWPLIYTRIQRSQPDTKVEITYERNGNIRTTGEILPEASDRAFLPSRGLELRELSYIHQAGFLESWPLGLRETKERIMEVFTVLGKLFTGALSPTNLAGAPMIVAGAVAEASQGYGRLLMFLTFLSCNLAVLNFLPIPVLDGGHMMFLIAEGLRGKPVDERLQMNLTMVGLILLLSLMVFAFALDIGRLTGLSGMIFITFLGG